MVSAESGSLVDRKRALRGAMGERRARFATAERAAAAAVAAARLAELPEMRGLAQRQAVLAGFVSTRGEIDPAVALVAARQDGARVAFPRVGSGVPRLRFHLATEQDLLPGRFGILEPKPSCPEVRPDEVAVMIVPGLAFDPAGHRLGFGGGYYDEALAGRALGGTPFVVGLGYDFQIVDACPADGRDARVDCIVTDARVIRCQGQDARKAGA